MIPLVPNPNSNKSLNNLSINICESRIEILPFSTPNFLLLPFPPQLISSFPTALLQTLQSWTILLMHVTGSPSAPVFLGFLPLRGTPSFCPSTVSLFVVPVDCPPVPSLSPGTMCSTFHLTFLHYNLHTVFGLPSLLESKS